MRVELKIHRDIPNTVIILQVAFVVLVNGQAVTRVICNLAVIIKRTIIYSRSMIKCALMGEHILVLQALT